MANISLSFFGGTGSVTGANFLLKGEETSLLVDCGLIQGEAFAEKGNREPFPYDPAAIDFLLVTHAHIDHIGRIPKLVRDGFRGVIYSTPETKELSTLMLPDALRVLLQEQKGEAPLYEEKDIEEAFSLWKTVSYHTPFMAGEFEAVFKDAGHILGSAMCEITRSPLTKGALHSDAGGLLQPPKAAPFDKGDTQRAAKRQIVFTGDLGNSPSPLLRDTEEITDAAYLVMESVYGDRNHERGDERRRELMRVVNETVKQGGMLLIPCFSLEKTQVLLHELNALLLEKVIPSVPVFLDSPLAIGVTGVYQRMPEQLNDAAKKQIAAGDDIFDFPELELTLRTDASRAILSHQGSKIIIAGSGMSEGGRIRSHERQLLSDPKNTILFVGYQSAGSLGRQIQEGVKHLHIDGEKVKVNARIETIYGYSSHKDGEHLLAFAGRAAESSVLLKVFLVMGEPKSAFFLAQRIRDYANVEAVVPELGDTVEIQL